MSNVQCGPDVAEAEFEKFCRLMDLDVETEHMSAEDLKSFESIKRRICRAIERGHVQVKDTGEPVFHPQAGDDADDREPITFHEPTGATILALDSAKEGQSVHKAFAALAEFTRQPAARYSRMANRDFKVCQALMTLFLA